MNNPFDNVPSSADVPETIDKKVVTNFIAATERFEAAVNREETAVKNQEELAEVLFEIFLDDDGTLKDFAHIKRFESAMNRATQRLEDVGDRVETAVQSVPTKIEVRLCDEDRNRIDTNFIRLRNVIKLHLPLVLSLGALVGICLMGSVSVSKSAYDKRLHYEQLIQELDNWHQENAEAISFGQFYHENSPKKYREWQTGRWQQDIAYRDSLIRAYSPDRLKRLYEDK